MDFHFVVMFIDSFMDDVTYVKDYILITNFCALIIIYS